MSEATVSAVDETAFADLVSKIQDAEASMTDEQRAVIDPASGEKALEELAGVSPEELQAFLEEKAGISPDEEAQGSVMAAAATVAFHC
ncbi:thioviridamide family RiPP peptide [Streptomyces roseoverticillatus]|uniref:thioviridamide family RiPP peptide n=1 Tax=Streptomyces roseoverticillatus TaxID=66429 RepID=UPI001F25B5CF|nr:thioviridamide family RiPP peptide [Streptomyces roseoverticillatus]MCF3105984.1 thioviridamide family RiPP peptide [Streptomyces roseoverticillatus]